MKYIHTLSEKLKSSYKLDNYKFKRNLLNAFPFWLGAFITGIVAVIYAKLFTLAENLSLYVFHRASWAFFLLTPCMFLMASWIVTRFSPYSRGSGIPQVLASIELANPKHNYKVNKLLGFKVIAVKIISSLMVIMGGGVIGREGPTIQISASIFKKINDLLPNWYPKISKQNMLVTGAAAGLASAFNTPLGGIVFAIEELTKTHFNYFKSALLTGVIIAGFTVLNILGPYLYLGYPNVGNISNWIIMVIIPVALIGGLSGGGMGKLILWIINKRKLLNGQIANIIYIFGCGFILASLAYFVDSRILGSGKSLIVDTLFTDHKHLIWYVPLLRILGSVLTFTTHVSGGIFAPSLSVGATIGAVIAGWFHLSNTETNLVILCGMVGFLTGITRSPFTSSILVIEMTNDHNIIFHLMVTALLANLATGIISKHSFYDHLKDQYIHNIHKSEIQIKNATE